MRRGQSRSWSRPRLRVLALTLATVAAALLVTGARGVPEVAAQSGGGAATPDAEGDVGDALYGRDCVYCHGVEGEGSPRGVPIVDAGEAAAHYALVTGRMPLDDPDDIPSRGPVRYTDEEVAALTRHVAGFGDGPRLPAVDWRGADVADGGQLYRLHCGACHGATAIGGALAYDRVAPGLFESEPSVVAAAVVSGPGAMPAFGQDFTDEELAAIVAHVQWLQQREDPGGWPIFRTGRPDEALVALGLAMPLLVAGAAWLARRPGGDAG
jgi:ubiquinol-cytochrome c reductase cytochrome c subunit